MIHVKHLSVRNRLLPLSFTCAPGELLHVVGPNGSGKSTLLSAVAGMTPYQGEVHLSEIDIAQTDMPTLAMHRAYLSQSERPVFAIDVHQYLALSIPSALDVDKSTISKVVEYLIQRLELTDKLRCSIHEVSGGEWQRVRLAGSCLQIWPTLNPYAQLLILDEPASALDIGQAHLLYDVLDEIRAMGITIMMANHDLNRSLRHATQILLLNQGVLCQWGTPQQVLNPATVRDVFHTEVQAVEIQGKSYLLFE